MMQQPTIKIPIISILAIFLAITISGCSPIVKLEQSAVLNKTLLNNEATLGQTFVAHYDGLQGIDIYFEPVDPGNGKIILELWKDTQTPDILSMGGLPIENISSPGFYNITFPPLKNSTQIDYYLVLKFEGNGSVSVGTAPGETYYNGAFYQNHQPQDLQLSFNLIYTPIQLILGLIHEGFTWIGYLLVSIFLFVIPGWALLGFLYPKWLEQDWASKVALSVGVSLAIYPLFFLWTDVIGLHLGALYAWIPPILGILVILWRNRQIFRKEKVKQFPKPKITWPDVTLIIILGMIFGIRFWVVRTLDAPLGGDSVHHTMITHLFIDNNGLVDNWYPYAKLDTFTYHFGFHSAASVFHWITKIPPRFSVLWVGQIFNGLACLALYPLAKRIGNNNKWAGVAAVFLAGLMTPMPMFYVNWGKYTQLTAQIILPMLITLIWDMSRKSKIDWNLLTLTWITFGGLALTHYRFIILIIIIFPILWGVEWKNSKLHIINNTIYIGLGSAFLFAPWLIRISSGYILSLLERKLSTPANEVSTLTKAFSSRGDLFSYLPTWMWLILPIILLYGTWKRNRGVVILGLWVFFVILAANPSWLNIPGDGILTNNAIAVAAYIPACILIGSGICWLIDSIKIPAIEKMVAPTILFLSITLGGLGMLSRKSEMQIPEHILVTRPDLKASRWIEKNTSPSATFLVNTFLGFGNDWVLGSDGGWWLPLIANRQTIAPPMIYFTELETNSYYKETVPSITRDINNKELSIFDSYSTMFNNKISHFYIGQLQGSQFNRNVSNLNPDQLLLSPEIIPIYHQDNVWVFEITLDISK